MSEKGVAVGTEVTLCPLTDPCERNYRTRLLPRVFDAESLLRVGMSIAEWWNVAFLQFAETLPGLVVPLTAPLQRAPPSSADFITEGA